MNQLAKVRWQRLGFIALSAVIVGLLSAITGTEFKEALYGIIGDKNVAMLVLAIVYNILAEVKNNLAIKKAQLGGRAVSEIVLL